MVSQKQWNMVCDQDIHSRSGSNDLVCAKVILTATIYWELTKYKHSATHLTLIILSNLIQSPLQSRSADIIIIFQIRKLQSREVKKLA